MLQNDAEHLSPDHTLIWLYRELTGSASLIRIIL